MRTPTGQLLDLQNKAGNRAVGRLLGTVQRMVDWQEGETATMDPILAATTGADWGFTHVLVNGVEDTVNDPLPLRPPKFDFKSVAGSAFVRVSDEAMNRLGTNMEIPRNPPWTADVPMKEIGMRVYGDARALGLEEEIEPYAFGAGNTQLRVRGAPSDGTMVFHTEEHEQRHVSDDVAAREEIVDPWDDAILKLKEDGTTFHGANPVQILKDVYEAAGGSHDEIGKRFFKEVEARGVAFHKTTEGGKPELTDIGTSGDQSTLDLVYSPPK